MWKCKKSTNVLILSPRVAFDGQMICSWFCDSIDREGWLKCFHSREQNFATIYHNDLSLERFCECSDEKSSCLFQKVNICFPVVLSRDNGSKQCWSQQTKIVRKVFQSQLSICVKWLCDPWKTTAWKKPSLPSVIHEQEIWMWSRKSNQVRISARSRSPIKQESLSIDADCQPSTSTCRHVNLE